MGAGRNLRRCRQWSSILPRSELGRPRGTGDVLRYYQPARSHYFAMKRQNCRLRPLRCGHPDDGEPALPAADALKREIDLRHIAVRGKPGQQLTFSGSGGEVAYM